nr:hypothetical protein [Sedimentibacter sp.]
MKNELKQFFQKVIKLWQSSNREYKNMKIGGMLFFVFGAICIAKYTYLYFALLMFCVAIDFLMIYVYVYNNISHFKRGAQYFLVPLIILLVATLVIGIPCIVLLGVISKILDFRAKKMDNLINFMLYSVITIIVISVFIYPNYILAYIVSKLLEALLVIKCNLKFRCLFCGVIRIYKFA